MKPTPIPTKPWLSPDRLVEMIAWAGFTAIAIIVALALSSCTFPEEGEGIPACEDCFRPPRPGPFQSSRPSDDSSTSAADPTAASGGGDASTDDGSSEDGGAGTEESGESSSTGGPAEYEPAHCDMTCPAGDALEPSAEQAGGTWPGCYCATPCGSDDDCGAEEHCEPFFGRCTIACMASADCAVMLIPEDPEAVVDCTLWWNDAEHFVHFCTYAYEDAP